MALSEDILGLVSKNEAPDPISDFPNKLRADLQELVVSAELNELSAVHAIANRMAETLLNHGKVNAGTTGMLEERLITFLRNNQYIGTKLGIEYNEHDSIASTQEIRNHPIIRAIYRSLTEILAKEAIGDRVSQVRETTAQQTKKQA